MSFLHRRLYGRFLAAGFVLLIFSIAPSRLAAQPPAGITFDEFLQKRFVVTAAVWDRERFCPVSTSAVARRVFEAYGAMFAAHETVVLPQVCMFRGESEVLRYQKGLKTRRLHIRGVPIDLQDPAADAASRSIAEAEEKGLTISAYDGAIAGGRSYGQTLMLWNSRFFPALEFWVERGRLSTADRDEIGSMDLEKKIERVLEWESRQIYFSTNRTRSILTSTAPPGTSQHLSLIALDVSEYPNLEIRSILNRNGWYQTVLDDPPHFTYLGVAESGLPGRGLRAVYKGRYLYWVPNISTPPSAATTN